MKTHQTPLIFNLYKKHIVFFTVFLYITCSNAQTYGWSELGTGKSAFNANGYIQAICTNASGNVYAVGGFDDTSNNESRYVAHWNGSYWSESGSLRADLFPAICTDVNGNVYTAQGLYNADGGAYSFHFYEWSNNVWNPLWSTTGFYGALNSICTDKKGTVYAGGLIIFGLGFTSSWGAVEMWTDSAWTEIDSLQFANGMVNSLCTDTAGNLYAAGAFTDSNGHEYVAKWTGSHWIELGSGVSGINVDSAILSICADSAGNIYASGSFKDSNGYYYVAKWNGSSWSELGNLQANGAINSICTDAAGNIYAAGNFAHLGYNYVAKWNGNNWSELGAGFGALNANGAINSICASPSDNIYAGGAFTDSTGYECVAKYGNLEPTGIFVLKNSSFNIYPNPTNNKLEIDVQSPVSNSMQITVMDISGQTLLHQNINPIVKNELDVSALPAGLYFIQLQDGEENLVRKFVKSP